MKKFLSIFLSCIIFVTYFILMLTLNFSNAFTEKNIKKISKEFDIIQKVKPEEMTPENMIIQSDIDKIYKEAKKYDISENKIDEILNSQEAKKFIEIYIQNSIDSAINGKEALNQEKLESELRSAINQYINNETDLNTDQKEKMTEFFDENTDKITSSLPSTSQITNNINPDILKIIQTFFSNQFKIILISIIIFCMISITLLQLKKYKWLLYFGIIFLISNISTFIFRFLIKPMLLILVDYNANIITSLIKSFTSSISNTYFIISGSGIIISIILLIIYKILSKETLKTISK